MLKYYVYERWLNGQCFYVGKGSGRRAYNFSARKKPHKEFVNGRQSEIEVKIIKYFEDEEEAFDFEEKWSIKRRKEGWPIVGMIGKESGMKGHRHSEEFKNFMSKIHKGEPLSKEHKEKLRMVHPHLAGKDNPNYGRNASKELRKNCLSLIKEFFVEKIIQCMESTERIILHQSQY